jgi:hypothetical protein
MTAFLGCGTGGENLISENVSVKQSMNTTWVSAPVRQDKPAERNLFGSLYDPFMKEGSPTAHDRAIACQNTTCADVNCAPVSHWFQRLFLTQ